MTGRRLTGLITAMKDVMRGIAVLDASLEMQPAHKVRPNKNDLERNQQLLHESIQCDHVSTAVNKKEHEHFLVKCGYCAATEKDDGKTLFRCPCKTSYYCSKKCQRKHWKVHKIDCERIRGVAGGNDD